VCMKHGAEVNRCNVEGCTNHIVRGGVCVKHGAKVKLYRSEGCIQSRQSMEEYASIMGQR
jgi:hypothetical protein